MSHSISSRSTHPNMPPDTALKQQRMKAWHPILDPVWTTTALLIVGAAFVPTGFELLKMSDRVVELKKTYDSHDAGLIAPGLDCAIDRPNANESCTIEFNVDKDMEPPILIYYEIDNFYQNHREYTTSRDDEQLYGATTQTALAAQDCEPLNKIGNITINPCGLIANTFFNDVIKLVPGIADADGNELYLEEKGIAWQSDLNYKFSQPNGFDSKECTSCNATDCVCTGEWTCKEPYREENTDSCWLYTYPNDDTVQYLYETYDGIISPLEGVENEHFIVWMRLAAKPRFRKLYGFLKKPVKAGTTLAFNITANWDVKSFKGTKSLIVTTTSMFGGKNPKFGQSFIAIGGACLFLGLFFGIKHLVKPRKLAHLKYLRYKEE
mmetsp:Transcript_21484/g.27082  ORF Transcript_21484/g.27082 Transcript_21484/m.27082 type:complete len:380 (-) Transcript_21484:17-1156(-)